MGPVGGRKRTKEKRVSIGKKPDLGGGKGHQRQKLTGL